MAQIVSKEEQLVNMWLTFVQPDSSSKPETSTKRIIEWQKYARLVMPAPEKSASKTTRITD